MKVFISKVALERARKDLYVKEHLKEYIKEVEMLIASQLKRPTEKIGDFNVTPRGQKKIRIIWHREGNDLYVDDFIYHVTDEYYVDKWNIKAGTGKINIENYKVEGYEPYETIAKIAKTFEMKRK